MPKSAIIPINYHSIQLPIDLKQTILLFDKIIIEENSLGLARQFTEMLIKQGLIDSSNYNYNNQNIEFLSKEGLIEFETINKSISVSLNTPEEKYIRSLNNEWNEFNKLLVDLKERQDKQNVLIELMDKIKKLPDSFARAISIRLNYEGREAIPINQTADNYESVGKKEQVLNFFLAKIPTPNDEISWEQILDFRNDPNTQNKYNALINWVNKIAKGESDLNELEDEYNSLYSDYEEQFKINKMKYKLSNVEIIVSMGIDFLTKGFGIGSVNTNLFKIWKSELNLLEAESKFSGKEIAYIHKVNQRF